MSSIKELEAQLAAARKEERVAEAQQQKRINEIRKRFLETQPYIFTVTPERESTFRSSWIDVDIVETIYISQKIDRNKYDAFRQNFAFAEQNFLSTEDLEKNAGMQYYLTKDGIIHYTGGGTVILKTPQLCSVADWQWLKAGIIPVKFLRTEKDNV